MNSYADPKDRWKLLSKELQIKQEVINRTKSEIQEKSDQLMEKGHEVVRLREENLLIEQEIYELQEKLKVEMQIANQQSINLPK